MLNSIVLVGRLTENPKLETDTNVATVVISVSRTFKNDEGFYENDFIKCILSGSVASKVVDYCAKGDMVGIKGRIQSENNINEVIAERVTFLSNKE